MDATAVCAAAADLTESRPSGRLNRGGLPEHVRRKITSENVAKLYRLSSRARAAA